jgi:hypothetical protein
MHLRAKLLAAALVATVVLGAAVVVALANRLSGGNVLQGRVTWTSMEFVGAGFFTIRCPVTLEGSAHSRTISKVSEALVGYVTSAFIRNEACTGAHATINGESLPWHVRYAGFTGTLPNIQTITDHVVGAKFTIEFFGSKCQTTTTASSPGVKTGTREFGGVLTGVTLSGTVPMVAAPGTSCAVTTGRLIGTGVPTDQAGARITVTLVQ